MLAAARRQEEASRFSWFWGSAQLTAERSDSKARHKATNLTLTKANQTFA